MSHRRTVMEKKKDKNQHASKKASQTKPDVSRRTFITTAVVSAGATAALVSGSNKAAAESLTDSVTGSVKDTANERAITVPDTFAEAAKAVGAPAAFPMTGAQVFA